jgi:hypothetical protein
MFCPKYKFDGYQVQKYKLRLAISHKSLKKVNGHPVFNSLKLPSKKYAQNNTKHHNIQKAIPLKSLTTNTMRTLNLYKI